MALTFDDLEPGNFQPTSVDGGLPKLVRIWEHLREVLAAPRKDAIAAFSRAAGSKIRLGARNYIAARNIGVGQSS